MGLIDRLPQYAQNAYRSVMSILSDAGQKLQDAVSPVMQAAEDVARKAAERVQGAADSMIQKAEDAAKQATEQAAVQATEKLQDASGRLSEEAGKAAKKLTATAAEKLQDAAGRISEKAGKAAQKALEKGAEKAAGKLQDAANEQIRAATDKATKKIEEISKEGQRLIGEAAQEAREGAQELKEWGQQRLQKMVDQAKSQVNHAVQVVQQTLQEAGETISDEVDSARSRLEAVVKNVYNKLKTIYVNAGCWGEGESDFVLVSGRYVVLCSWLTPGAQLLPPAANPSDSAAEKKIRGFLNVKTKTGQPSIQGCDRALLPLTDENQLFVFVGDLHVHLFTESLCDNFVSDDGNCVSLAAEFGRFIHHAVTAGGATSDQIVQVGDCFEVWESQILMHLACEAYLQAAGKPVQKRSQRDMCVTAACRGTSLELPNQPAGRSEADLRESFCTCASPEVAANILNLYVKPSLPGFSDPLDFTEAARVEERIRAVHSAIPWNSFIQLRGNHDNGLANSWLEGRYKHSGGDSTREQPDPGRYGEDRCIAAEHGDALDSSNCRAGFDDNSLLAGFNVTMWNVKIELKKNWESFWGGLLKAGHKGSDVLATKFLEVYTLARANALRGGPLPNGNQRVRLIVLGHSHETVITSDDATGTLADEAALRLSHVATVYPRVLLSKLKTGLGVLI
jgi:vacuolar-type H+-ATPase subunit H